MLFDLFSAEKSVHSAAELSVEVAWQQRAAGNRATLSAKCRRRASTQLVVLECARRMLCALRSPRGLLVNSVWLARKSLE